MTETICGNCRHSDGDHRTLWWQRATGTDPCAAEGCECPEFVDAA